MRTLTLITLLCLAACAEESPHEKPHKLTLTTRSSPCVSVEPKGSFAVRVEAQGLPNVAMEIHYYTGASEVWILPQGAIISVMPMPAWAKVYPALVFPCPDYPVLLHENGDGTVLTTTGAQTYPARMVLWHDGASGSWEIR